MSVKKQRNSLTAILFWVGMAVMIVYFCHTMLNKVMDLQDIEAQQEIVTQELNEAQQWNHELRKESQDLNTLEYIERIAREQLGMTKKDELPYNAGHKDKENHPETER